MSIILMFIACFSPAGVIPVNENVVVLCGEGITVNYDEDVIEMEDNFFQALAAMEENCK